MLGMCLGVFLLYGNGDDADEHVLIGWQCRRFWRCCYERALMGTVLP